MADDLNLDAMDLSELRQLRKRVDQSIETFGDRAKQAALSELEEVAKKHGFKFADLADSVSARKRGAVAPKYADPDNPESTWTGRGRKPRWVAEALEGGKSLEDLAIA